MTGGLCKMITNDGGQHLRLALTKLSFVVVNQRGGS